MPRTYDLVAFSDDGTATTQSLDQSFGPFGTSGSLCTGIKKLMQRFLCLFFLPKGGDIYDVDAGCDFMHLARKGSLKNNFDVATAFALSESDVRQQLKDIESDDDPADERIARCSLTSSSFSGGAITLNIAFRSQAGEVVDYVLPISIEV